MKKMRMLACVCVGSMITVLIWHFICGCQSPAGPGESPEASPTPLPAPETREVMIEEGIILEEVAEPAPERLVEPAPITVSPEAAAPELREETISPPAAPAAPYVIRKGDTLWKISRKFGVSVTAIQEANGITDPGRISVGQKLTIPTGKGAN